MTLRFLVPFQIGDTVRITVGEKFYAGEVLEAYPEGVAKIRLSQGEDIVGPVTYNFGGGDDTTATDVIEKSAIPEEDFKPRVWFEDSDYEQITITEDINENSGAHIELYVTTPTLKSFLEWWEGVKKAQASKKALLDTCERDWINGDPNARSN